MRVSISRVEEELLIQWINAFQSVAGIDPNTEIHSHKTRITFHHKLGDVTEPSFGKGFSRMSPNLRAERNAVRPRVGASSDIEDLGPDSQYPINRVENTFRWGTVGTSSPGVHPSIRRHLLILGQPPRDSAKTSVLRFRGHSLPCMWYPIPWSPGLS